MSVLFDVADIANQYSATRFYEHVREAALCVLEASNLEIDETQIRDFYQRFAFAYIIGVKTRDPSTMVDLLQEDTLEPLGNWELVSDGLSVDQFAKETSVDTTFLAAQGSPEQHQAAFGAAVSLLAEELTNLTGFAGLIESLYPGRYQTYVGDSFNDVVLICE
ncbi:hypothetical protein DNL62_06975 [Salmonella enterica subsp. enterica serovar Typhimurium]|nr:hypothetical protein [Salmonella enterica subsp. enterica serovar Typhimurium]